MTATAGHTVTIDPPRPPARHRRTRPRRLSSRLTRPLTHPLTRRLTRRLTHPLTRRLTRRLLRLVVVAALVALAPTGWLRVASAGRIHSRADAPDADVAIVFGAQLDGGGTRPSPFLAYRLDTAAALLSAGKVRALLVSGDGNGGSGDEVTVMTRYLLAHGVPADRIVPDRYGLDTYDTCRRARDVYGVRRALLVSQALHLHRAITLCRSLGVRADGVDAGCPGCQPATLLYNNVRELPAAWKALYDTVSHRPPAVTSPPMDQLARVVDGNHPYE